MSGIVLVTVPIGNADDITIRALNTLKKIKYIFAEDTRVTKKLLNELEIPTDDKNINSFHDHSEEHKLNNLINLAKENLVAIVSDAGSPLISDPAYPVVQAAINSQITITTCSGINAVTYALELSALAPTPFHFHGFIGRENSKKNELYELISSQYGTHIFFEGVSRVIKTTQELSEKFQDFEIVVARELSKNFESVYRFKGKDFESIKNDITEKGEFVILVNNPKKISGANPKLKKIAQEILDKGSRPKLVSKLLAEITDQNSKEIYEQITKS